jgi:hypothetical protein
VREVVAGLAVAAVLAGSAAATAPPTVRLEIVHNVRGCHVWKRTALLGPAAKLTLKPGTRVQIRDSDPMDFEFTQLAGPKLALGLPRMYAGTLRTIVFAKRGLYKLSGKNVQMAAEVGLEILGTENTLTLTVLVK